MNKRVLAGVAALALTASCVAVVNKHIIGQTAFIEAVEVTGVILTKLDGTAKGGIVFAIASELGLPVRFIGTGEEPGDLAPFEPEPFVEALLSTPETAEA